MMRRALVAALLIAGCTVAAGAETAVALIARADKAWSDSQFEQAQRAFEAAAAAEPRSAATLLRLAGFQLSRQQLDAGIVTYQRVIGLDARNIRAWLGLGLAYVHTGKSGAARAAFDEVLRIEPQRKDELGPLLAKLDKS